MAEMEIIATMYDEGEISDWDSPELEYMKMDFWGDEEK